MSKKRKRTKQTAINQEQQFIRILTEQEYKEICREAYRYHTDKGYSIHYGNRNTANGASKEGW